MSQPLRTVETPETSQILRAGDRARRRQGTKVALKAVYGGFRLRGGSVWMAAWLRGATCCRGNDVTTKKSSGSVCASEAGAALDPSAMATSVEVSIMCPFAEGKKRAAGMYTKKRLKPFHIERWDLAHRATDYDKWINASKFYAVEYEHVRILFSSCRYCSPLLLHCAVFSYSQLQDDNHDCAHEFALPCPGGKGRYPCQL